MLITEEMKMAELIHLNYNMLNVLKRFNIRLGFGEKTIKQVCNEYNVDVNFFMEISNAFNDYEYFPNKNLQKFSVELIINYLKKTHQYYLTELIPIIEKMINEVDEKNNIGIIKKFFLDYKNELTNHIAREETVVYPYVLEINNFLKNNLRNNTKSYSISIFADEHDNVEEKLSDLKNIIIKYLPSEVNNEVFIKILKNLFLLEKDLNDHSRIEEKVMIPMVKLMEKKLSDK